EAGLGGVVVAAVLAEPALGVDADGVPGRGVRPHAGAGGAGAVVAAAAPRAAVVVLHGHAGRLAGLRRAGLRAGQGRRPRRGRQLDVERRRQRTRVGRALPREVVALVGPQRLGHHEDVIDGAGLPLVRAAVALAVVAARADLRPGGQVDLRGE